LRTTAAFSLALALTPLTLGDMPLAQGRQRITSVMLRAQLLNQNKSEAPQRL
jgi:hypothetical protein